MWLSMVYLKYTTGGAFENKASYGTNTYIQTYNFDTVLRDYMPRAKALGNKL